MVLHSFSSDYVLISVGFYIGDQTKKIEVFWPLFPVAVVTVVSMLVSEAVAKTRGPKIQPQANPANPGNQPNTRQSNIFVISNLIPFANLNLVFVLGIFVRTLTTLFNQEVFPGAPLLSIQASAMLLCTHFLKGFFCSTKTYPHKCLKVI